MPGERAQGHGSQRHKSRKQATGNPDRVKGRASDEPGEVSRKSTSPGPVADHIDGRLNPEEDPEDIGHQQRGADREDGGALHIEAWEPIETGQPKQDAKQGRADRPHAEGSPERRSKPLAERSGDVHRKQGKGKEGAGDQGQHSAEPTTIVARHTRPGGVREIRRSK